MWKNAEELIREIEGRKNRGRGLEHFRSYMEHIHSPHEKLSCIHVAGTNGKGSTVNYIRSMLQQAGYKVGTFTSPYLITHRDRIRIQDSYIPEDVFTAIAKRYYPSWMAWDLSMFEIDMAIACLWFVQEQVDIAVFEVGLGGRLDFTNIITPLVSVITNIGMDHMEVLGDTYEEIAKEKAGIIKEGIDVITAEEKPECLSIFEQRAKECHSCCQPIREISEVRKEHHTITFLYDHRFPVQLSAEAYYQCRNAALALETIWYLRKKGKVSITDEQAAAGLLQAVWLGRFEILRQKPLVILDGAHNADGIRALCQSLQGIAGLQVVFSVLKDKSFEEMLDELEKVSGDITVCHFMNSRALELSVLKKRAHIQLVEDHYVALKAALIKEKPLVITGSLYFISEARKLLTEDPSFQKLLALH